MQEWSKKSKRCARYGLVLYDGFSNHCLANTVEPLRAANMLSGRDLYNWSFLTVRGMPATSSSGLVVQPHMALAQARGDLLLVMPSYGFRSFATWQNRAALAASATKFPVLAGLDTGSWLLAHAGLLSGVRATIHWEELAAFTEAFPETDAVRERFVIDGTRITCGGAMAAFDLVMNLIGRDHGQALALEVAQLFMSGDRHVAVPVGRGHARTLTNRAIALMQEHIEDPLTIAAIAQRVGCTQKTLEARMRVATGAAPKQVYRRIRLIVARKLVSETNQPVSEISLRCGYQDASAMTRAFKSEFGTTPRAIRSGRA